MKKFELDICDENIKSTIYKDVLGRNNDLVMLAKLLLSQNNNLMLSLDGNWGSGKTFFIKQFEFLIRNIDSFTDNEVFSDDNKDVFRKLKDNSLVIYYNAWENDNHEDPLQSIMYNILNEFPNQKKQLISIEKFREVVKGFARDILKKVSLDTFDISHFDKLENYEDITKVIVTSEEKRKAFDKLINDLLTDNQRLILIVDELDRCKPTFAVRLLETLKHFYNNDKITIIVVTNNKELSHTIKKFYGNEFDGYGYLSKFYDAVLSLEVKDIKKYLRFQLDFCKMPFFPQDISYAILKYFDFSLRECNKYVSLYNLLKNYMKNEPVFDRNKYYILNNILLPLAIALKIKDVNLFRMFMNNKGQSTINNVLISFDDSLVRWVKEMVGKTERDYKIVIIDYYEDIFSDGESVFSANFHKIISFLGSDIYLENN